MTMKFAVALLVCLVGMAVPEPLRQQNRIIGGSLTTISQYPFHAVLLYSSTGSCYSLRCSGALINNRSVLSAARCTIDTQANNHRLRVGSSYASSGGVVYEVSQFINHPEYDAFMKRNDIAILRSATEIVFQINTIQPATIAGNSYNIADNTTVWAVGHGSTYQGGSFSEHLRHVQIWTVNQQLCQERFDQEVITNGMICSAGWLGGGGLDICDGDFGGPLVHNSVVVGVASWGYGCNHYYYPRVYARVSAFTSWIVSNA